MSDRPYNLPDGTPCEADELIAFLKDAITHAGGYKMLYEECLRRITDSSCAHRKEIEGWKAIVNKLNEDRFPPSSEHAGPVVYEKTYTIEQVVAMERALRDLIDNCDVHPVRYVDAARQALTAGGEHDIRERAK